MTYEGEMYGHFETGTEGVVWCLLRDPAPNDVDSEQTFYDRLINLEDHPGAKLTVCDPRDGRVVWQGVIDPDRKANWREYPRNPGHGQPVSLGMWCHWIQRDMDADTWGRLFFRLRDEDRPDYRGRLETV